MPRSTNEQSFAHHTKLDPAFHYFAGPVFVLTVIATIVREVRRPSLWNLWAIVFAVAATVALALVRQYALKVQDRVIRLEERLRLAGLAEPTASVRLAQLSEKQLVAIRFASDAEAPALAEQALVEKLGPKQIKQAIRVWRPDHWRV